MVNVKKASEFGEYKPDYIFPQFIKRGNVSLIIGDRGTGKTHISCAISAKISNKGQRTLMISSEEDGETLKALLQRYGANLEQVFICDKFDSVHAEIKDNQFECMIKKCKPDLIIIDVIQAFMGEKTSLVKINDIRIIMHYLAMYAKKFNCAICCVSRKNKKSMNIGVTELFNSAKYVIEVSRCYDEDADIAYSMLKPIQMS